jgi:hypothetical protein
VSGEHFQQLVQLLINKSIEQFAVRSVELRRDAIGPLDLGPLALHGGDAGALVLTQKVGTNLGLLRRVVHLQLLEQLLQLGIPTAGGFLLLAGLLAHLHDKRREIAKGRCVAELGDALDALGGAAPLRQPFDLAARLAFSHFPY